MAQWNQVFHRDIDQVTVADAEGVDALRTQCAEHRGDLGRMTRDAGEERRVGRHEDDVRRARLHHLGVRGLAALRPLHMTQVDEPEAVALGLEILAELHKSHADRSVVGDDRLSGEYQDLEVT